MGAELIAFVSQGPNQITKTGAKSAERLARQVIKFAGKVLEVLQKNNKKLPLTSKEEALLENALQDHRLRGFIDLEQIERIDEALSYLEDMAGTNANDEVAKFVDWWNKGGYRDTVWSVDRYNAKGKIVVCGDTTWGDPPDGYGYQTMRRAYWFGIPGRVGVR